jgi:hypothetical protein
MTGDARRYICETKTPDDFDECNRAYRDAQSALKRIPKGAVSRENADALTPELLVNYTVLRNMYRGPADALQTARAGRDSLADLSRLNEAAAGMLDTLDQNMAIWRK